MNSKVWTLSIILLASLAIFAVALTLVATPADASVTGKPVPPLGSDWVIDQDTTILSEGSITIRGDIIIMPGYTFSVRNSAITINSSSEGEHGIYIDSNATNGDGVFIIRDSSVKSDYEPYGWYFMVYGALDVDTNVRFWHVQDGIWIYSDNVDIYDMTLYAQGVYGIYVENADPLIQDSTINLKAPESSHGTGIRLSGSYTDLVTPDFQDLDIKVYRNDVFEETASYSRDTYFRMTGFDAYNAELDDLNGITVTFDATADGMFNNTGTPRWYVYFYLYGFQFHGDTILGSMDIEVSDANLFIDADAEGSSSGTLYIRNYFRGLENYIGSGGESPATFTGFEMRNIRPVVNLNNIFNPYYYHYGRGFIWEPSTGSMSGDTITVDGIVIDNIEVERMVGMSSNFNQIFQNNLFINNTISRYFHEMRYIDYDVKYINNDIINNTMQRYEYFYMYRMNGDVEFSGNNISENTYYRMFYWYYPYGDIDFTNNDLMGNEPYSTTSYIFYVYNNYGPVDFTENYLYMNKHRYMWYFRYTRASVDVKLNTIENNTGTDWAFYTYNTYSGLDFEDNQLLNNTWNGFIYSYYQRSLWLVQDNYLEGNQMGNRGFYWIYGYVYGNTDISDNYLYNNTAAGSVFELFGVGYRGTRVFTFERNTFIGNSASTSNNGGLVHYRKTRQTLAIRDNYFENNSANCIVFDTPYYYGYRYQTPENNWFYVEDNYMLNNSGKGILFYQIDNNHIQVRGNEIYGHEDYAFYLYCMDDKQYIYTDSDHERIYCYYNAQGPDTLIVEANNMSMNPGGGMSLRTSQTDSSPSSYYAYGNPNQVVRIKKNMLYDNGPDGWSLAVYGLYSKPTLSRNYLDGSSMGFFIGLIDDNRRTEFQWEVREVVQDGGPAGLTAYGFKEVDATIYDSVFTNYMKCFYAEDCEVNVYWSAVPEASGETVGKGRIYVWNHLDLVVTWANATAVDSGIAVPGAVVAMLGANGKYFPAQITDDEGKLPTMLLNPWTCVEGVMDAWSPFKTTIMSNDVSTPHSVHVIGEFLDPDPMKLTLNDIFIPEVIISNPQDDTLVKTADVLGEGFLFEIGSGITVFEGPSDQMGEDEWEPIDVEVLWEYVFEGMTEGYHNLSVRAADLSGNWNTSTIEIIVDLTDPDLSVVMEYLNTTRIPYDEERGGYFVRDREIAINGTYGDNFAPLGEIIIRLNGVPEYIFPSQWGTIYKRIKLDQGINTIIVDATDTAGNRAVQTLYVWLDSYPPTMYIYNPLDGERTANPTMKVIGLTEPETKLEFIVQSSAGTNTYYSMSDDTGAFAQDVELFEGIQKILVTATDSAGNPTLLFRDVTLDTTPPDFIINSPPSEHTITNKVRYTIVATMTSEPDADFWIGGQLVDHKGVPQREVVLQEGENVIEIKAIDKVGNEKVSFVTIVRDTVPPVLTVTAPEGDYLITNMTTIHFSGLVEGSAGVDIVHKSIHFPATLVEGDWDTGGVWEYDLELGPQDLEQDIEVVAFDLAENEAIHIVGVRLDIVPPSLHIEAVPEVVTTPFVEISGTTDAGIPIVRVQGQPYPVENGVFTIQWSLVAGENRITVTVQDEAGNVARDIVTTTYDYTPPPPPPVTDDGTSTLSVSTTLGIAILLMAIVILIVVLFVTKQRSRR